MTLKKRRKNAKFIIRTKKEIICNKCKNVSIISSSDVINLLCGNCFIKEMYYEELKIKSKIKIKEKYPRGWHLRKEFIDHNGKKFSFGKEIIGDENDIDNNKRINTKVKSVSRRISRDSSSVFSKKNKKSIKRKKG